jgi:hypothetical protein
MTDSNQEYLTGILSVKRVLTLLVFLLAAAPSAFPQQVTTFTDRDSLRVGDIFELTYIVQGSYQSLTYPGEDEFDDNLEVLSRQRFQTQAGRDSLVYRMQFFGTEDIVIPSKNITLHRTDSDTTLTTARIPIYFKTVLAEGDEEFRPLKPIFDFARAIWPYLVGLLLLAVIGYLLYRWFVSRESAPEPVLRKKPAPFLNPLDELKNELGSLPAPSSLNGMDEFENYYIRLGDAIRRYLKRVYEFPALEMTTREITGELQKELAASEIIRITRSVLNEADMVKFANFKPDTELAEGVRRKAAEFVQTVTETDRDKIEHLRFRYEQAVAEREQQENENKAENPKTEEISS